jgi:type III secretory pathway component EscR
MSSFLKNIRDNNAIMAVVILLAYYLIVKVLKYLVKLVRHESYTNSGSKLSPFLQKQLEGFRNKKIEKFRNNRVKLGKSTRNNKTNRK